MSDPTPGDALPDVPTDLVLHGAKTGNCLRAAVGLLEADIPFRIRRVDLSRGEHLEIGPDGKVPVLTGRTRNGDAPFVLTQSNAILAFADALRPGRLLPMSGDPARIAVLEAYFFIVTDVIGVNGAAFRLQRQGHMAAAEVLHAQATESLQRAERFLGAGGYLGGDRVSMVDLSAVVIARAVSAQIAWDRRPALRAWFARILARPGVQQGLAAFD